MVCLLELEVTKAEIRIRILKKKQTTQWPKEKVQKDKQRSIKHTNLGWTHVLRKSEQFLLH